MEKNALRREKSPPSPGSPGYAQYLRDRAWLGGFYRSQASGPQAIEAADAAEREHIKNAKRLARACSACGQSPKLEKTAIPDALQLSHLCPKGRGNDFGEFGSETELVALWNHQQNAELRDCSGSGTPTHNQPSKLP